MHSPDGTGVAHKRRMRTKLAHIPSLLSLLALAFGCSSTPEVPEFEEARSAKSRLTAVSIAPEDQETFAGDNLAFALMLYNEVLTRASGESVVVSPHSISSALAMTYAGARESTESEMKSALEFGLEQPKLHRAFNALDLALSGRGKGAFASDGNAFRLAINNAVFAQKGRTFEQPFLDTLAENYGAGIKLVDFLGAADVSRVQINDWVSSKTEEKIKDLLLPGTIGTGTKMVLINTIYLNAAWGSEFSPNDTYGAKFSAKSGDLEVPTMHQTARFPFAEVNGFTAVELPYQGGELAMDIILPPTSGALLSKAEFQGILAGFTERNVQLSLPKFRLEPASVSLRPVLEALGMKTPFTDQANLSGISAANDLFISDVIHKAFIDVKEKGTEAAAATAVVINEKTSASPEAIRFAADRPFHFVLRDRGTRQVLFIGHVAKP